MGVFPQFPLKVYAIVQVVLYPDPLLAAILFSPSENKMAAIGLAIGRHFILAQRE